MVQRVGHEGRVVGQPLAHAQRDGLTGEQTVAARRSIHGDGDARRQHGDGQHPQKVHDCTAKRKRWEADPEDGRSGDKVGWVSINQQHGHG